MHKNLTCHAELWILLTADEILGSGLFLAESGTDVGASR
jgi:hypothetical protein